MFQSVSIFSLYNPLFQCFETPEMGPGLFTFFRACFNFVSKRLKHLDLVNFLPFSVFSLYNPLFQCFETPEMGPGIFFFLELVSILFRNISKQLKHLDLVNFLPVSVRFNFFPI